ncbi:transglycosylase family protein [Streptomyces sp. NPDC020983]|uniref:LysM peptidoglycan-binding domain-containing protein n=1 Tax=Streptomyces sp. NPDC020983 TaxID=3365106 RepID=UPI0037B17F83
MLSANGRHRRPRQAPAAVVTMAATGAGLALPLLGAAAGAAQAADGGTWDKVAICESGGQWDAASHNGVFGGLSLTQDVWVRYGGLLYAPRPDLASRAHQIKVAERILTDLGPDAFPGCELGTGLLDGNGNGNGNGNADGSGGSADDGGTGATDGSTATPAPTTPADPSAPPASTTPGAPAATPTAPATPTTPETGTATPAPPAAETPAPTATDPGAPADGSTATPAGPSAPPASTTPGAPATGSGRHARPYSPTDEELAAADRATRTRTTAVVPDADGEADARQGSGAAGNTQGNSGNSDSASHQAADTYEIGAGDSLSGIAAAHDVPGGWLHLYDANRQAIGDDPNLIKPGQIIDLG